MPCNNPIHSHSSWPRTGSHSLLIETCETKCGWCGYETKAANNLRVHARRHILNPENFHLKGIKIVSLKAGRSRLTLSRPPFLTTPPTAQQSFCPDPILCTDIHPQVRGPNPFCPFNVSNDDITGRAKAQLLSMTTRCLSLLLSAHGLHDLLRGPFSCCKIEFRSIALLIMHQETRECSTRTSGEEYIDCTPRSLTFGLHQQDSRDDPVVRGSSAVRRYLLGNEMEDFFDPSSFADVPCQRSSELAPTVTLARAGSHNMEDLPQSIPSASRVILPTNHNTATPYNTASFPQNLRAIPTSKPALKTANELGAYNDPQKTDSFQPPFCTRAESLPSFDASLVPSRLRSSKPTPLAAQHRILSSSTTINPDVQGDSVVTPKPPASQQCAYHPENQDTSMYQSVTIMNPLSLPSVDDAWHSHLA